MRSRLGIMVGTIAFVAVAIVAGPRVSGHAQDQSKDETLAMTLRKFHGRDVQLRGVDGEMTIMPMGKLYTENRTDHVLVVVRGVDSFVIPHSAIVYFREKQTSPGLPTAVAGPAQLFLASVTAR